MSDQDRTGELSARGNFGSDPTRADQDPSLAQGQDAARADDAPMGSPKGGGTHPAHGSGLGRYGGADATDDANALEAGTTPSSGLDPMGGPGARPDPDLGNQDAMSAHGGGSTGSGGATGSRMDDEGTPMATFGPGGTTAAPSTGPRPHATTGEWAESQLRERTQPWGSGGDGEVH
jgi:hypothetical protein